MNVKIKGLFASLPLIVMFSGMSFSVSAGSNTIVVENAWIREAPPGAGALAGYAKINNTSVKDVYLQGADSVSFGMSMLHMTQEDEQHKMSMHHMASLKIPAKSSVQLQPGGTHIMLMRPARQLKAGDEVVIMLNFSDGITAPTRFTVIRK
jgi:copper(I)-binding protein